MHGNLKCTSSWVINPPVFLHILAKWALQDCRVPPVPLLLPSVPAPVYKYVWERALEQWIYYSTASNIREICHKSMLKGCYAVGQTSAQTALGWTKIVFFFHTTYPKIWKQSSQHYMKSLNGHTIWIEVTLFQWIRCWKYLLPNLHAFFCHVLSLQNPWHHVWYYFIPWVVVSFENGRRPSVLPPALSVYRIRTQHMVHGERKSC